MQPIALLRDLIALPSVNPMGRAVSGPEYLRRPDVRLSGRLFRAARRCPPAYRSCAGTGERCGATRSPRQQRDGPVRRPSGHRSRRRYDRSPHFDLSSATDGFTAAARATSRAEWRPCSAAFARLVEERPPQAANVVMSCTCDEESTVLGHPRSRQTLDRSRAQGITVRQARLTSRSSPNRPSWTSSWRTRARRAGNSGRAAGPAIAPTRRRESMRCTAWPACLSASKSSPRSFLPKSRRIRCADRRH